MVYDVVIIGAGPAGLTAGIYAKRACLSSILLQDKYSIGSQICNTYEVCNYPGFNNISGQDLYDKFKDHARTLGLDIKDEKVQEIIDIEKPIKKVITKTSIYECKTVVIATGASPKKAGLEREDNFVGNGISYCATCDGAFYNDKIVAVIGGGDVAAEDAIFLSRVAKKVYLIVRKPEMRAVKTLQEQINKIENIEVLYNTVALSIIGDDKLTGIVIKGISDKIGSELSLDGLFVGIGTTPDVSLVKDNVKLVDDYIDATETCETSVKGVYAVGDVRRKQLRQVITACADGANAITSIQRYLNEGK